MRFDLIPETSAMIRVSAACPRLPPCPTFTQSIGSCSSAILFNVSVGLVCVSCDPNHLPAMPNGAKKPAAVSISVPRVFPSLRRLCLLLLLRTHEAPESNSEESGERVEWDVVSWALGVVVRRGELAASRGEGAAADGGRETGDGALSNHLSHVSGVPSSSQKVDGRTLSACCGGVECSMVMLRTAAELQGSGAA